MWAGYFGFLPRYTANTAITTTTIPAPMAYGAPSASVNCGLPGVAVDAGVAAGGVVGWVLVECHRWWLCGLGCRC